MDAQEQAWNAAEKVVYVKDSNESTKNYSKWVKNYENDLQTLGYRLPNEIIENLLQVTGSGENQILLDVGAGTGLCAKILLEQGYKGTLDAMEFNHEMLQKAREKSLYRNYYEFELKPEKSLPVDDNTYDVILCVGSLLPLHIAPGCIVPMSRTLKKGGIIAFNTRNTEKNKEYIRQLDRIVDMLVESGSIEQVLKKDVLQYKSHYRDTGAPMLAQMYLYRKL